MKRKNPASFLLSVWALVLRKLRVAVFRREGALVGVKHILGFGDVGHLVGEVVRGRVPGLSDFVPEPRASPAWERGAARSVESKFHLKTSIRRQ